MNAESRGRPVELVLFDAVGTLIYPDPPVLDVYHEAGKLYGSDLGPEVIRARFASEFRESYRLQSTERSGQTSEFHELARWRLIVRSVFPELAAHELDRLFAALWNHFADPQHWRIFDDVELTLAALRERGIQHGIASNFDERLHRICGGHAALAEVDFIFVSSQLGWSKPAMGFYRQIEQTTSIPPQRILFVGDDYENDVRAPLQLGWQARWLCRTPTNAEPGQIRLLWQIFDDLPP